MSLHFVHERFEVIEVHESGRVDHRASGRCGGCGGCGGCGAEGRGHTEQQTNERGGQGHAPSKKRGDEHRSESRNGPSVRHVALLFTRR